MTIEEFVHRFADEQSCRAHWKAQREKAGISCYKCHCVKMYWNKTNDEWRCSKCKTPVSLRRGTVMQDSNLPFRLWYKAIWLMTQSRKGISALEMQRQLGHKFYEPVWYMMHKLRVAMGDRDSAYELSGILEGDDAFITVVEKEDQDQSEMQKRGRGSQRKRSIIVLASTSKSTVSKKGRPASKAGYFKMFVVDDLAEPSVTATVFQAASTNSHIKTDGHRGYQKLKELFRSHNGDKVPAKEASKQLPWVHIAISNLKATLRGIYHHITDRYLQNYLDEFCYKLNRRWMSSHLFNRLIVAASNKIWA